MGALLLAAACGEGEPSPPQATASPTPPPSPIATATLPPTPVPGRSELPARDPIELAHRLGRTATLAARQLPEPPPRAAGDREEFTLILLPVPAFSSTTPPSMVSAPATLAFTSEHAYFYVQEGIETSQEELMEAARTFEEVYATVTAAFGREWSPGVDRDPRIAVLHAGLGEAVGGYFSGDDEYLRAVSPLSNEREMVYLDGSLRPFGGEVYRSVLAHELQHLIHQHTDADEELWVDEGLAEVAAGLVGGGGSFQGAFLAEPDVQLTTWEQDRSNAVHYGASNLFFLYLLQRFGGTRAAHDLAAQPADGIAGVEAFLDEQDAGVDFVDVFADWVVATYLDEEVGIYGYRQVETSLPPSAVLSGPGEGADTVHQFAADYLEVALPQGDATFGFEGDVTVPVLANQPHSGSGQWWSGRGDAVDTTLTRELDLTGLRTATLTFWTWFDIERWYDYGYVEISTDEGESWQILRGRHSTDENPLYQAYGPAYSGLSGGGDTPAWVEESIDLTPFTGGRVLLRFEYVTDEGLNRPGWAIDDIAVVEAGFFDDAEDSGEWEAHGFTRLTEPLPQRFIVRVIEVGRQTTVRDVELDADNRAEVRLSGFGAGLEKAVIVVAAVSEGTTEVANYRYSLMAGP